MILVCDVGNSNICFGIYKNDVLVSDFRIKTAKDKSFDEYYLVLKEFINEKIDDVIISSVVPVITSMLVKLFGQYYNIEPKIIGNKMKTKIKIIADDPHSVGTDLICDVSGATSYYDEGLIIDLGSASKFIYYKNNSLLGVTIAPGVVLSTKTLSNDTALLPNFELVTPKKVLNNSTIPCLQAGVIYGFASMVDGLISKILKELNKDNIKIIGTGGLINLISASMDYKFDRIDNTLTLQGIYKIYKNNI